MTTLTISRSSGGPLVIAGTCSGTGMWLGEGFNRPELTPRYTYAPDSAYVAGRKLLAVTREAGVLAGLIYARGHDAAEIAQLKEALEDALWQFTYEVTFSDGRDQTWDADPVIPSWGPIVPGHDRSQVAQASVTIPLNPRSS